MNTATTQDVPMWQCFAGSSIGKAHIDANLPNQDHVFIKGNDRYSVAVVCDGAGSAKHSEVGSQFFSQAIGEFLLTHADALFADAQAESLVRVQLNQIRNSLNQQLASNAKQGELRDYHTTVTAIVLSASAQRALVIRVGDSPLIHSRFVPVTGQVDYFVDVNLLGDDSKTEYVNETHFITQDNWQDFLRVEWLDTTNIDLIALMSDGCADLVIEGAKRPMTIYRPFFGNLLFNLCTVSEPSQGHELISEALANPATYRLTGDDKTLAVLIKNPLQYRGLEPMMQTLTDTTSDLAAENKSSVWHQSATSVQPSAQPTSPVTDALPTSVHSATVKNEADETPTTALPPPAPMSNTGKQRRNTAIIAGLAALAGAGTLLWVHQNKPSSTASTAVTPVASQPMPTSSPVVPSQALLPVSLDEPVTVSLTDGNDRNQKSFDVVLAIATDSQNQPLVKVTPKNGTLDFAVAQQSVIASMPASTSANSAALATAQAPATLHCEPVTPTLADQLANQGVAIDKTWHYQHCRVTMALTTNTVAQQNAKQLQLPKGLSALIQTQTKAASTQASTALASAALPTGGATQIQLYYLPNTVSVSDTPKVASATASATQS